MHYTNKSVDVSKGETSYSISGNCSCTQSQYNIDTMLIVHYIVIATFIMEMMEACEDYQFQSSFFPW